MLYCHQKVRTAPARKTQRIIQRRNVRILKYSTQHKSDWKEKSHIDDKAFYFRSFWECRNIKRSNIIVIKMWIFVCPKINGYAWVKYLVNTFFELLKKILFNQMKNYPNWTGLIQEILLWNIVLFQFIIVTKTFWILNNKH